MFDIFKFVAIVGLLLLPAQAFAQSCGSPPALPKIVRPADIKQKSTAEVASIRHQTFVEVKDWQSAVLPYRDCLTNLIAGDKQKLGTADSKKDADKVVQWKTELADANRAFDASVDKEELMVAGFHAIQAAYCMRQDSNSSACPQ